MLQRDHDIMIHIIRYCERVKSYLKNESKKV